MTQLTPWLIPYQSRVLRHLWLTVEASSFLLLVLISRQHPGTLQIHNSCSPTASHLTQNKTQYLLQPTSSQEPWPVCLSPVSLPSLLLQPVCFSLHMSIVSALWFSLHKMLFLRGTHFLPSSSQLYSNVKMLSVICNNSAALCSPPCALLCFSL